MRVKCGLHFTRILRLWCFGLDAKMLPCIYYDVGSGNMKWMKFWDTISSILVLLGLGLYGSSCYYGAWSMVYAALGCIVLGALIAVFTQRCPFCRRYLGMMFFSGKKTHCPYCGSDVRADRNV